MAEMLEQQSGRILKTIQRILQDLYSTSLQYKKKWQQNNVKALHHHNLNDPSTQMKQMKTTRDPEGSRRIPTNP